MNRLELCIYATLFVYCRMNGNTLLYSFVHFNYRIIVIGNNNLNNFNYTLLDKFRIHFDIATIKNRIKIKTKLQYFVIKFDI